MSQYQRMPSQQLNAERRLPPGPPLVESRDTKLCVRRIMRDCLEIATALLVILVLFALAS